MLSVSSLTQVLVSPPLLSISYLLELILPIEVPGLGGELLKCLVRVASLEKSFPVQGSSGRPNILGEILNAPEVKERVLSSELP